VPQQTTRRRAAAVARARTALPRRRRAPASETWARRGAVAVGVLVVASLVVGLIVANGDLTPAQATNRATAPPEQRRNDPNALIAAATRNPDDADTVRDLADSLDRSGQFAAALPLYERYVRLRPDDARARLQLGELLLATGDTTQAQAQFSATVALMPPAPLLARAHIGLGDALLRLAPPRPSEAVAAFVQAADLDPDGEAGAAARDRLATLPKAAP